MEFFILVKKNFLAQLIHAEARDVKGEKSAVLALNFRKTGEKRRNSNAERKRASEKEREMQQGKPTVVNKQRFGL